MKTVRFILILFTCSLAFSSCKKECSEWHEGDDCERMTKKFTGTFIISYECTGNVTGTNQVIITEDATQVNRLRIIDDGVPFYGDLYASGKGFEIPEQEAAGGILSGLGYINDQNKMILIENFTFQAARVSCTGVIDL